MAPKKSLYEILEVPAHATYAEIRASYERLVQALDSRQAALSRDDHTMQMRLLRVAYNTLATPSSRDAYDASLAVRNEPAQPGTALLVTPAAAGSASPSVMRADALMMRAEAIALRADALGLKADLLSGQAQPAVSDVPPVVARLLRYAKRTLLTLGTLAAIGMVLKVVFLLSVSQQPGGVVVTTPGPADDKAFLQEYYQTYGVRPASRAEAALLDAERRKNEEARRAQKQQEDAARHAELAQRRFEEDARRRGEQASIELRYAEERARQAQQEEERQREYEARAKEEAERERTEAMQERWRQELKSSGRY